MKRIKLQDRVLPSYTKKEELWNTLSHSLGGVLGCFALAAGLYRGIAARDPFYTAGIFIYGLSMIWLYAMSSIYHGLPPGMGKRVLQILDHCTIYCLIAGTYTPISVTALRQLSPLLGWGMLAFQWSLAALAITLTAIDLKKYRVFSMVCYLCMGWAILPFLPRLWHTLGNAGSQFLLWGGIAYTFGAILYGIGSKKRWFHTLFHFFVLLGSALQMMCILGYLL